MSLALAICEGVRSVAPDAIILGLAGSCLLEAAQQTGLRWASEVFADRAYLSDGSLVPRSQLGAVITDRDCAIRRAVRMVKEGVVYRSSVLAEEIDDASPLWRADSVGFLIGCSFSF